MEIGRKGTAGNCDASHVRKAGKRGNGYYRLLSSQKYVPLGLLRDFPITLPPLPEQQQIAGILSAVDKKIEAEQNIKASLQTLFQTMLHLLMTGKVRVKELISS